MRAHAWRFQPAGPRWRLADIASAKRGSLPTGRRSEGHVLGTMPRSASGAASPSYIAAGIVKAMPMRRSDLARCRRRRGRLRRVWADRWSPSPGRRRWRRTGRVTSIGFRGGSWRSRPDVHRSPDLSMIHWGHCDPVQLSGGCLVQACDVAPRTAPIRGDQLVSDDPRRWPIAP